MKVFRFYTDVDKWSTLIPADKDQALFDLEKTRKRARNWKPPTLQLSATSRAKHGDFRDLHSGQWAVTLRVAEHLAPWFTRAGELLPIKVDDGNELYWFNCTDVRDAFDWDAGEVDFDEIMEYAFDAASLDGAGLFRLPHVMKLSPNDPDTWVVSWYQFVAVADKAAGFPAHVAASKYRGIEFREVWSDD